MPCNGCAKQMHVECALQSGCKLGFDLQSVKSTQSRREGLSLVRIGSEGGLLVPVLYCLDHVEEWRTIHSAHELVGDNEESVLALYSRVYKATRVLFNKETTSRAPAVVDRDFYRGLSPAALLNRNRELKATDATVVDVTDFVSASNRTRSCEICKTVDTPCFHHVSSDVGKQSGLLCHRCYWHATHSASMNTSHQPT